MSYINKNIKTGAIVMVAAVLAAALLAAFAFSPTVAFAQETTRNNGLDDRQHRFADRPGLHFVKGAGVATGQATGDNFRSGFMVITQKLNNTDVNEHKVLRGLIAISVDGERIGYKMLPETWKIIVAEDGHTLQARGQVKNAGDKTFEVSMKGYFAIHSRLGNLWSIDGTMTSEDNNTSYELHYVAISPRAKTNYSISWA